MVNQERNLSIPKLAIIVPCYNEEPVIKKTSQIIEEILDGLISSAKVATDSFVCFVDDGSKDKTWDCIEILSKKNRLIKGIKLSNNFGHQNALLAGMFVLDFDICVTMDADLQDSPSAVTEMLEKYKQGYQIVYGVRSKREKDSFFKLATANTFYSLMKILGVRIVNNHADFRLLSREVVNTLKDFREVNIFLRGIVPYLGYNSTAVYYSRVQRLAGQTKYPLRKMISFAWNGITSFSIAPLRVITFVGFLIFVSSFFLGIYAIIANYLGKTVRGWTSILLSLYALGGLIIFFLGIIGEYIGKIYMEVKQRPRFVVEKKI